MLDEDDRVAGVDEPVELPQQQCDVRGVQPRRRLVEQVERVTAAGSLEFGGQFDALRLTTAELRRGLPQPQIPQSHLAQRLQTAGGGRYRGQEVGGGVDGQLQHVRDVLAAVGDFQRLGVVPGAVARRARRVRAGQEQQLDRDESFALAGLAAPFGHVEGEPSGRIAARPGLVRRRVQLAHRVEHPRVRGQVGPGSPADGSLVDPDQAVERLDPRRVLHVDLQLRLVGLLGCESEVAADDLGEDLRHQRRLSGTGHARHRRQHAERYVDGHVVQIVAGDAAQVQPAVRCARAVIERAGAPEQVLAGGRFPDLLKTGDWAAVQHASAALTRAGADVDHPVRPPYDVHVVFHDEQRVARRLEAVQHVQQRLGIRRVQARGGFVEDVDDAEQP